MDINCDIFMVSIEKFKQIKKTEAGVNRHLFLICSVVTIIIMLMMTAEFFSRGVFPPVKMNIFYLGVLIIYSLHKEVLRWLGKRKIERQGEGFVYSWIGLTTLLYLVNFLTKDYFAYSARGESLSILHDVSLITLEVLAIFILTRSLKALKIYFEKK